MDAAYHKLAVIPDSFRTSPNQPVTPASSRGPAAVHRPRGKAGPGLEAGVTERSETKRPTPPFALSPSKGACHEGAAPVARRCFDRLSTNGGRKMPRAHHCSFHWKLMLFHPPDGVE